MPSAAKPASRKPQRPRKKLRILSWNEHGHYLRQLTQLPHDFWLVADAERSTLRSGRRQRSGSPPLGDNVHEAPLELLRSMRFDLVLYQSRQAWESERLLLSEAQRQLPCIVLEHDLPQQSPSASLHWCQDPRALLVHVTPFNALMWDSGVTPSRVVEHGVKPMAEQIWSGELAQGLLVMDHIAQEGRCLGLDIWQKMAQQLPLTLVGIGSEQAGGAGEVAQQMLPGMMARHRFLFHPARYSSLDLAVIEAMMMGLPVVGLATAELAAVITSGKDGFVDNRMDRLVEAMQALLLDRGLAAEWGRQGRALALERYGIKRFIDDWCQVLDDVAA